MMKNNIMILLIWSLFLPLAGKGQINFVQNPSFEQYSMCPDMVDEVTYCTHWHTLDSAWRAPDWAHDYDGVPEYCHTCASYAPVSIPHGFAYIHYARTGNGMMQMQLFSLHPIDNYQRDHLQSYLRQGLINGHTYEVTFYTVMAYMSGHAVNNIAAYFDDGTIDSTHSACRVQTHVRPQIIDTSIISDTLNWTKIQDTFTANGTEKLITIGQFTDSAHTNFYAVTSSISTGNYFSWYLIDDVSVIDCDNMPHAGNDTVIHPSDSAFLGTYEPLLPYKWYKLGMTTVIDSTGGIWVKPTVTTSYVVEQMLCGVKRWDTVKIWVWPDTPTSVGSQQLVVGSLMVYPNPATSALTVEGAKGCEVVFFDVVGRKIASYFTMTNKEVVDISKLHCGVYLVQVTDESTGARAVKTLLKE